MPMYGDGDDAVYVSPDDALAGLIDWFDDNEHADVYVRSLQAIRRAYLIETTDFVGEDGMIGAKVTFVDTDGDPHRGLVMEPNVTNIPETECWDPHRGEMVDPSDYPLGTVQLIRGDGWEIGSDDGFFDRVHSDHSGRGLTAETSVQPATGPDDAYCYYPGWEYADAEDTGA